MLRVLGKSILLTFVLFSTSYAENDKALHYGVSVVTGYVAETVLHKQFESDTKRIVYGTLLGTVPGLIKEIMDENDKSGAFDEKDLLADIAGAFTGAFIASKINKNLFATVEKKGDAYAVVMRYQY